MVGCVEVIRRALVQCLVLIAGTPIEQAPSVGPLVILFCTIFQWVKWIDYKDIRINVRAALKHRHVGNIIITPVLKKNTFPEIQDRIIYKVLMLTYKLSYNMAPPYLCELINKKRKSREYSLGNWSSSVYYISKDCSNTFLERSFIYTAPCEWKKLSEHIRTENVDCFREEC